MTDIDKITNSQFYLQQVSVIVENVKAIKLIIQLKA